MKKLHLIIYLLLVDLNWVFCFCLYQVFQTQVQAPIVSVPPTLIVEDIMSDPEDGSKIKYHCPNCQLGELVINYEHEGDCRHDCK